jgi:hypothetical protein
VRKKRWRKMKGKYIAMVLLVFFVLIPAFAYAQTAQQEGASAPLSQPLVREGTFAVMLAQDLKVGGPSSETEAESELSAAGITPRNGWIADYPVTPDIIGELQVSIGAAADSGKISMGKEAALTEFNAVLAEEKLDVRAGGSEENVEEAAPYPDTSELSNYYYDEGPPVVTYYAPPPDYAYLYTWVPYPFWWTDFWFPGFFILGDFDVDIHHHHGHEFHHGHGFHHGRDEFVTNHFRDSATGRMGRIDPAHRWQGGHTGIIAERGGGWTTPSARSGAAAIFNRSRGVSSFGSGRVAVTPSPNRTLPNRSFSPPARSISPTSPSGRVHGSTSFSGSRF